jgi:predicted ATPase
MDNALPLPSFEVEGYRAIRHLRLPQLERVNLFVGLNNAGKTSLLEAVRLYLLRNSSTLPATLFEIVRSRSDYRPPSFSLFEKGESPDSENLQAAADAVESLFYGSFEHQSFAPIRLTVEPMAATGLTIQLPWHREIAADAGPAWEAERDGFFAPESPLVEMRGEGDEFIVPFDWFIRRVPLGRTRHRTPALMIGAGGLDPVRMREMWDRVAVAGQEGLVEDALRTVVPDLDRVLLVGESSRRSVLLKLSGATRPIPIQSMGDGVYRVFGIALGLVLSRGGALLLDEVENGLHHSVQLEVWESILALAQQFNVQVFATTHSWDTVVAFQAAANESSASGMLYRLEREADGSIYAERYTDAEVAVAAEQQVEVR